MSEEYDNTNSGVLFPNNFKDNPKQPDLKGDIDIEGVIYKIAAWTRESSKSGGKFLSIKAELKDKPEEKPTNADPIGDLMEEPASQELPPSEAGEEDMPF